MPWMENIRKIKKQRGGFLLETSRVSNKGMPNIYLKITIEKNWRSQKFDF